jgi:hypothetical protein
MQILIRYLPVFIASIGLIKASPLPKQDDNLKPRAITYQVNQARANEIREDFLIGWYGYYKYAFPHDQLKPVTNGYTDYL